MEIDYKQCEKCGWNIPINCSQQHRRPKKGDKCPTFKPKNILPFLDPYNIERNKKIR